MKINISTLEDRVKELFADLNFSEKDLIRTIEPLMWAELAGIKPMGIAKLTGTEPLQNVKPSGKIAIEKKTDAMVLINAHSNPATLASQIAVDHVITKAKNQGISFAGVHNFFTSNLSQAYYVDRMAREGLVGIACSRSAAAVSGFGGIDPLFGTNPIGFGLPTLGSPLIFDMTTSAFTWYGLVIAKLKGLAIPENIAVDSSGGLTTDPAEAMNGAILPFDRSYKGAGLSMMVELLAGPLVGAGYGSYESDSEFGATFIAINPELLTGTKNFADACSDLINRVKSARKQEGVDEIRLPGERAGVIYENAKQSGFVDVDEQILKEIGL